VLAIPAASFAGGGHSRSPIVIMGLMFI